MSGILKKDERGKFMSWAKAFGKQMFSKSIKNFVWKEYTKKQGPLRRLVTSRKRYSIEIDWENVQIHFLGFADGNVDNGVIKMNGQSLLNLYRLPQTTEEEWHFTELADIVGVIRFTFANDHLQVSIQHKKRNICKCETSFNMKQLNEIMKGGNIEADLNPDGNTYLMVVFGQLNILRIINFTSTDT